MPLDTFDQKLADARNALKISEAKGKSLDEQEADDRSAISYIVIWTYAGITVALFSFVIGTYLLSRPCSDKTAFSCVDWAPAGEFLLKVTTSTVLPIVTLVLGYYFGSKKSGDL